MNAVAEHLEFETKNLTLSLDTLVKHFRQDATTLADIHQQDGSAPCFSVLGPRAGPEVHEARRSLLTSMSKLHWLLDEPAEFMQNIIIQSQLISCLTWLAEFQVLAYIPLRESVPISDIAELAGLPVSQLARVIRMTATSGFLCEPQPDYVAHTSLSVAFVQRLSYLDATLFLGKVFAPEGLRMAETTKRGGGSHLHHHMMMLEEPKSAALDGSTQGSTGFGTYTLSATPTPQTNNAPTRLSLQNPKLQRSWSTFLQCLGDVDDSIDEVLIRLDWNSLGKATIVDIFARSVQDITVLANRFPALSFIVQSDNPSLTCTRKNSVSPLDTPAILTETCSLSSIGNHNHNHVRAHVAGVGAGAAAAGGGGGGGGALVNDTFDRVAVQKRTLGSPQTITDAAVYLLRIPSPSSSSSSSSCGATLFNDRDSLRTHIRSELTAHLAVLRANPAAKFVLSFRPLPEAKGLVDPRVEAMARARDLAKMALTNGGDLELREVLDMVDGVRDEQGRLAVMNKIQCQHSATVVVSIRYQAGVLPPQLS